MSLFEKKYEVEGWNGKIHLLTAEQLYERVLEDSKSDYNWIASATELVRVCNQKEFPEWKATVIKTIILNCFANLELKKEWYFRRKLTDRQAVYSCYHSLQSIEDERIIEIREKYLKSVIRATIKYMGSEVRFPRHTGPCYVKVCKEWEKEKFEEWCSKEKIDFDQLKEYLYADFDETIQKAEEAGTFEEDDRKESERIRKCMESLSLKINDFYM